MLTMFFHFIILGLLMFVFDFVLLKIRKRILISSYMVSGVTSGVIIGLSIQETYIEGIPGILFPLILSLTGSLFLYIVNVKDLSKKVVFRLFGTLILGFSTGLVSFLLVILMQLFQYDPFSMSSNPADFFINLLLNGFLLQFGYAFSGRISQTLFRSGGR